MKRKRLMVVVQPVTNLPGLYTWSIQRAGRVIAIYPETYKTKDSAIRYAEPFAQEIGATFATEKEVQG